MSTKAKTSIFGTLVFVLLALFSIGTLTSTEVTKARPNGYEFTGDTLVESESATFTIPQQIKNKTGYFWQITVAQDSFATDASAILYESAWESASRWYPKDTVSIAAAGNYRFSGTTDAKRLQVIISTDTTNSQIQVFSAATLTEEF